MCKNTLHTWSLSIGLVFTHPLSIKIPHSAVTSVNRFVGISNIPLQCFQCGLGNLPPNDALAVKVRDYREKNAKANN